MKQVDISYKLYGMVTVEVPDDFEINDKNINELIRQQSDEQLIAGVEHNGSEVDGDAIEMTGYSYEKDGRYHDV